MARNVALQRDRTYLHQILLDGDLTKHKGLEESILLALESHNPDWISKMAHMIRLERIQKKQEPEEEQGVMFPEPKANQLRGKIYIGKTTKSRLPALLPLSCFGGDGHVQCGGTSGSGKSTVANFMTYQLAQLGIPVLVIDQTGQVAQVLLRHLPDCYYLDASSFQWNPLRGPKGKSQRDWLQFAGSYLREALDVEPMTWQALLKATERIARNGEEVSFPRLIEYLSPPSDGSDRALLNRLYNLAESPMFSCEKGFDIGELFSRPTIANVHGMEAHLQRFVVSHFLAHYMYSHRPLVKWKLRNVVVIHEAKDFVESKAGNTFFFKSMRECRNFGLGIVLLNQSPQAAQTDVLSNIKTYCLFSLPHETSVDSLKNYLGLNMNQRMTLAGLPKGTMLVKRPDLPSPFLVKVPRLL